MGIRNTIGKPKSLPEGSDERLSRFHNLRAGPFHRNKRSKENSQGPMSEVDHKPVIATPFNSSNAKSIQEQIDQLREKTSKAEVRIAADVWDTEAWTSLVLEAQKMDIEVARDVYVRFLKVFPTAGRYWKYYAEHEMASNNHANVTAIFTEQLIKIPSIDFWKSYVNYVQNTKSPEEATKAYEAALDRLGGDIASTPIWIDYLNFINEQPTKNQLDEGQKNSQLRRIYQRAIEVPMHKLEDIWKQYDAFENGLNKTLAKQPLTVCQPKFMNAKAIYREKKRYYEGIHRNMLPRPPSAIKGEDNQPSLWKGLVAYEKTNPQRLEPNAVKNKIAFTYNQALLSLYHYPEIWYEYAEEEAAQGRAEESAKVYERAIEAIPDCLLLYFAYANSLETQKNIKGAKDIYERLLKRKPDPLVYVEYMQFIIRTEDLKAFRLLFKRARALIEWHRGKDEKVANNVFTLGMSKYSREAAYISEYLKFLLHLNEERNIRVLFEKAVSGLSREEALEIWNMYLTFEYSYGDLDSITKLEKRKAAAYPELYLNGILSVAHRHRYHDLWPCSFAELDSFGKPISTPEKLADDMKDDSDPFATGEKMENKYPKPDLTLMIPLKTGDPASLPFEAPASNPYMAVNLPPDVNALLQNLPQTPWQGPMVDVEGMIAMLMETPLPPPPAVDKRKREDEEEMENMNEPVQHGRDIFTQRQMAKLSKTR
ncbi:hypothetical protein PROFUN_05320 [Planoprotostelium fungivorum]|uniref:Suppressor of forked domain-containing protein n=1 Tax=Planoprotostelium fungivorum TaxID=1890364 RepID=A0A2P6NR16_9EUKA|nr:hypothetical protein PROFUN_05320 [Planoprotostelium fungivorum]